MSNAPSVERPWTAKRQMSTSETIGQVWTLGAGSKWNPAGLAMSIDREEVRFRGKSRLVPSEQICGRTIIVTGGPLKLAQIKDEELVERELFESAEHFLSNLRRSELRADIFTFAERPPQVTPRYDYFFDWDNWAVLPTTSYSDWMDKRLSQESRKNIRRAAKRGVGVQVVPFDDELVAGIQHIYNESAIRQGRRFWHFGKDFAAVKLMNQTYCDRGDFIGAFFEGQLIGFIKMVYVDDIATLVQILAMNSHQDKRPVNALIAYAVEHCERKGKKALVYGKYDYGTTKASSLAEFKRRMGFEKVSFPRYYVPLTVTGRVAIRLGLHAGLRNLLPPSVASLLLECRSRYYRLRAKRGLSE